MKIDLYPRENKFVWSLCIVCTVMAFSLSLAAISTYLLPNSISLHFVGMICGGVYAVEVARQSYKYQRRWPQWSMLILCPGALFSLLDPPTFVVGVGVAIFNLLLWLGSYKYARRLVLLSPQNSTVSKRL